MADSGEISASSNLPSPRDFVHPVVTAVRQANPALIDEMLRNIVIGAGNHAYVMIQITPVKGGLGLTPRYYEKIPPICQDSQITLRILQADSNHPKATLVDHQITSLPPETQKLIRSASVLADDVSTVHYPKGREPEEIVEAIVVEEVEGSSNESSPGEAAPMKDPSEATTHYVPEFEIWWQTEVQSVMADYFKAAKKGRLKTGGRLRIVVNKDRRGNSILPIWYGFEQFPERGPLPPPQTHQQLLFLIKIKGDLTQDPSAYKIVEVSKDLPETLKQRWEAMMKRVVGNYRAP
jgi:hypothetical protein